MNAKIRLNSEPTQKPASRYCRQETESKKSPTSLVLFAALVITALGYWCWDCATLDVHATRGNANAQYRLGKRNLDSAKTCEERAQAVEWIRKAADQGHAGAQTGMGLLYTRGVGLRVDYSEAVKWLNRAAEQDVAVAQNELGVIYAKGRGVPQNLDEALLWCGKAAEKGSKIAKRNLALIQAAKRTYVGDLTTSDGKVHRNVTLQSLGPDGITVTLQSEQGGLALAKVKAENLTGHFRELCGYAAKSQTNSSPFSQLDSITARL